MVFGPEDSAGPGPSATFGFIGIGDAGVRASAGWRQPSAGGFGFTGMDARAISRPPLSLMTTGIVAGALSGTFTCVVSLFAGVLLSAISMTTPFSSS